MNDSPVIPTLSSQDLAAFQQTRQMMIDQVVNAILQKGEFQKIYGDRSREIVLSGMTFTARTLEAIMTVSSLDMITQQLIWAKGYLTGQGISLETILHNFELFADVIRETLPPEKYPALTAWMQLLISEQQKIVSNQ